MEFLSSIKPHVWMTAAGIVFIIIGLIFVYVTARSVRGHIDAQSWPQAEAVLTGAEVIKRIREGDAEDNYRQYVSYFCEAVYSYSAGGKAFSAKKWLEADSREEAVRLADAQKRGERVPLYYDPGDPENYVFEQTSPIWGLIWLLPFLVFAGFGWAVIYVGRNFYME